MGVRSHHVGDPDLRPPAALRRPSGRQSHRKRQPLLPQRRQASLPAPAARMPQGDLRPHEGVLAEERARQAKLQGDPSVPTEEEPRIRPQRVTMFSAKRILIPVV